MGLTTIGTLNNKGELTVEDRVDFSAIPSPDPIAYYFGRKDALSGMVRPPYPAKELASEYKRGWKDGVREKIENQLV